MLIFAVDAQCYCLHIAVKTLKLSHALFVARSAVKIMVKKVEVGIKRACSYVCTANTCMCNNCFAELILGRVTCI